MAWRALLRRCPSRLHGQWLTPRFETSRFVGEGSGPASEAAEYVTVVIPYLAAPTTSLSVVARAGARSSTPMTAVGKDVEAAAASPTWRHLRMPRPQPEAPIPVGGRAS